MVQLISVIIPTYNRASLLTKAIESVLSQSYKHLELIIVDDASTDETSQVIRSFSDPRIKYIYLEKNRGAATARNYGINQAKGDIIAFLDSDDVFLPGKLDHQIKVMNEYPISLTGCVLAFPSGEKIDFVPPLALMQEASLLGCRLCPGSTMMCHKQILIDHPFDETLLRYEDWDWFIRQYLAKNNFYILKEKLSQISLRDYRSLDHIDASLSFLKEKYTFLIGYKKRYLRSGIFLEKAAFYVWKKNYIKAIWYLTGSILLCHWNIFLLIDSLKRKLNRI